MNITYIIHSIAVRLAGEASGSNKIALSCYVNNAAKQQQKQGNGTCEETRGA